jgi:hypothetical protein
MLKERGAVVDRVRNPAKVLARAMKSPVAALVVVEVRSQGDAGMEAVAGLCRQDGHPPVVVLYPPDLLGLRDAVLAAGASEALCAQPDPAVFEGGALSLCGISGRRHPRVPVTFPVRVYDGAEPRVAMADNLSMGGVQLRLKADVRYRGGVRLELMWKGHSPLSLWAIPVGSSQVRNEVVVGFRFAGLSEREREQLEGFLGMRGGVSKEPGHEALRSVATLEIDDLIRLASGVDATASSAMRAAASMLTHSERTALLGTGGEASDADPLCRIAVIRLKVAQLAAELEKLGKPKKGELREARDIASEVFADFAAAHRDFNVFVRHRVPSASPPLVSDLHAISRSLKRASERYVKALQTLSPELADHARSVLENNQPAQ